MSSNTVVAQSDAISSDVNMTENLAEPISSQEALGSEMMKNDQGLGIGVPVTGKDTSGVDCVTEANGSVIDEGGGINSGGVETGPGCFEVSEEDDEDCVVEGRVSEAKGVDPGVDSEPSGRKRRGRGKKKGGDGLGYCASDLVWAKVRSHPWWPGQVFEPGDASDKARKHSRSKSYLVAYYWDQTFAWNDEATLKPFAPYFPQMIKQSGLDAFKHAVDCVLDEVSRRVEFRLSCRCIAEDVYERVKTQVVENAGIREESRVRQGGDRFFTASSFEPVKFLDYVKSLGQEPGGEVDRLEHVVARSQMLAFYRWKGCYHLAEFSQLIGYVNNEADAPKAMTEEKEGIRIKSDDGTVAEEHGSRSRKRTKVSSDGHCSKKVKIDKKGIYKEEDEEEHDGKLESKSSSSVKRKRVPELLRNESKAEDARPLSPCSAVSMSSKDLKQSFSVGASILRVASKLSQPSPLLKLDVSPREKTTKAKVGSKRCGRQTKEVPADCSSDEILSELHVAATEPLEDQKPLSSMLGIISDFRNSVVPDSDHSQKHEELVGKDAVGTSEERAAESGSAEIAEGCSPGSKSKENTSDSEIRTMSDLDTVEDADCTDKVPTIAEQQTSSSDKNEAVVGAEPSMVDGVSAVIPKDDTSLGSQPHTGSEFATPEKVQSDEKTQQQEDSATALTLKFTDAASIPSEAKLNTIFSHFGPLKESETEVLAKKNCARVVFERRLDAETAFSSSGKFEIFGPSLVCYRLNYAPSLCKSPSADANRRRKDGSPSAGNSA